MGYCGNKKDQSPLHVDMVLVDEKANHMYAEVSGPEAEKFKMLTKEGQEKRELDDKFPRYDIKLVDFEEFHSASGKFWVDTIGAITGVSNVAYVHLPSNHSPTAKRVISLKDLREQFITLVLWGSQATDFDADTVHSISQHSPVVAIFVGMLKSYKSEITLS